MRKQFNGKILEKDKLEKKNQKKKNVRLLLRKKKN